VRAAIWPLLDSVFFPLARFFFLCPFPFSSDRLILPYLHDHSLGFQYQNTITQIEYKLILFQELAREMRPSETEPLTDHYVKPQKLYFTIMQA